MKIAYLALGEGGADRRFADFLGHCENKLYDCGIPLSVCRLEFPEGEALGALIRGLAAGCDLLIADNFFPFYDEYAKALEDLTFAPDEAFEGEVAACLKARGISFGKDFKRRCALPEGAVLLSRPEDYPAVRVKRGSAELVLLPYGGDPVGLLKEIAPELLEAEGRYLFKLFGLTREEVLTVLQPILHENRKIADFYVCGEGLDVRLSVVCKNRKKFSSLYKVLLDNLLSSLHQAFQKNIYAEEDVDLPHRLFALLKFRKKRLSAAESLTGGLIASSLVEVPGSSSVFFEGVVTYHNEAKSARLGVSEKTLRHKGAVSVETAFEMAKGLLDTGRCDIALATTGIAGPTGATPTKPLGLCYIAVGTGDGIHVFEHIFAGDRAAVRLSAAQAAMFYAVRELSRGTGDL